MYVCQSLKSKCGSRVAREIAVCNVLVTITTRCRREALQFSGGRVLRGFRLRRKTIYVEGDKHLGDYCGPRREPPPPCVGHVEVVSGNVSSTRDGRR